MSGKPGQNITKAAPPKFAEAKRAALKALAAVSVDEIVPDEVHFVNRSLGFELMLTHGLLMVRKVVPWHEIEMSRIDVVGETVSAALSELARSQH